MDLLMCGGVGNGAASCQNAVNLERIESALLGSITGDGASECPAFLGLGREEPRGANHVTYQAPTDSLEAIALADVDEVNGVLSENCATNDGLATDGNPKMADLNHPFPDPRQLVAEKRLVERRQA